MKQFLVVAAVLFSASVVFADPNPRLQKAFNDWVASQAQNPDASDIVRPYMKLHPTIPPDNASPEVKDKFRQDISEFYTKLADDPDALAAFATIEKSMHLPSDMEVPVTGPTDKNKTPDVSVGKAAGTQDLPPKLLERWESSQRLANANPSAPQPAVDYGTLNFVRGNSAQALTWLGKGIENGDHSAPTLTLYGRAAADAGDYDLAYQSGQAALGQDKDYADARALVLLAKGKTSTINLPSALARVGLNGAGAAQLAAAAGAGSQGGAFGDGARQDASMASAAGVDPVEQAHRAELAAIAARQSVVPPSKIQQSAMVGQEAAHSLQIGDYPGAYTRASQAIALNNQNAQAWNYRAMAATNMQRYSDAVYDASYSISLEAKQAAPLVTRSWAFSKQGKYKEAEYDARVALEKAPENAYAYHDLAYALAGEGRRDEALDALRRAAAQDSRFKGKLDRALQLAQNEDMTLLFADAPVQAPAAGAPVAPPSKSRRFLRLLLLSMTGGLIIALAVLHVVSASWREKVNATIRRVLSSSGADSVDAAGAAPLRVPAPGSAFWEQYELVRELGAGGMGLVYEAQDKALGRRVAVKKMRDEIRLDPMERQRFIQEARMVAALHHPNIVDIYNIVEQDQDVFLVFEYVPGKTLGQRLDDGALSFAEARAVLSGVCSAVDYAHSKKIIHRDLKPSNIMLRDDGLVKVMDFGVARQAKDAMTKMSMTNTVVGTPPYMAPEQEQGTVRMESDVFALGVVLYESLSGELPFLGMGAGMLLNKINGKHEPLSKKSTQALPPGLDEVVAKALQPDPDKRYRTPAELIAALDALQVPSPA